MSFTQKAYSDIDVANTELQAYFTGLMTTRGWNPDAVVELRNWSQSTHDANLHWYGDDVEQFWIDIANGYRPTIDRITQNDPSQLQNWDGIGRVLGADVPPAEGQENWETVSPASIAYDTTQATGLQGAMNVAQDQLDDIAARQRSRNERFEALAPFIIPAFALGALYVVIKAS